MALHLTLPDRKSEYASNLRVVHHCEYHLHLCEIEYIRHRSEFANNEIKSFVKHEFDKMNSGEFVEKMDYYDRFGLYHLILSACQKRGTEASYSLNAFICTQRNIEMDKIKVPSSDPIGFVSLSLLFVDGMTISERSKYSHLIFEQFIELYVYTELLSTLYSKFNPNVGCKDYQKNKECDYCNDLRLYNELHLGYLMNFCAENILHELNKISIRNLKQKMLKAYSRYGKYINHCVEREIDEKIKRLMIMKEMNSNLFKNRGGLYINNAFIWFQKNKRCGNNGAIFVDNGAISGTILHILGKFYWDSKHNFLDTASQCFVMSAFVIPGLYWKVLSLRALSDCCFENRQYLFAKKLLKVIYILCNGYFLPSFVEKEYGIKMKKCQQKIEMIGCGYCGKNEVSGSCTGCLKVSYCSKRCQKKDWKRQHSKECDKYWHSDGRYFYSLLKNIIFDPVFQR